MIDFNYTLLVQFANVLILLILLNFLLFKPVMRVINKRESTLGSLFGRVTGTEEEARRLAKAYDEGAKEKKRPILENRDALLSEAHAGSIKVIEQARNELAAELAKVRDQIDKDSKTVFNTLKGEVDRLSSEVAAKMLKRSL
jgi:F-type H+-transporting ATPase subunit b